MAVIINRRAGAFSKRSARRQAAQMTEQFHRQGIAAEVQHLPGHAIAEAARKAMGRPFEAIIAGGGDGTVNSVAGVVAGSTVPLGVLPLGTLNHFARDLKMPLQLEEAIRSIAESQPRAVDLAEVNGHAFVNNSSLGAYPHAVEEREALQRRRGHSKRVAMLLAGLRVLFRRPLVRCQMEFDGQTLVRTTSFIFVGNNVYSLELFAEELRPRLDTGLLCVLSPRRSGVWCLARLAWQGVRGALHCSEDLEAWNVRELWLRPHQAGVRVAVDGEVIRLRSPLHYRIHAGALRVLAPS